MPGPTAFCQYRQKVHESARGDPLVLQGRLPNWVYCMYKRQNRSGSTVGNPTRDAPRARRSGSVTLIPLKKGEPWSRNKGHEQHSGGF